MERFSQTIGQNVNLGILDRNQVVYVERIKKKQILNSDLYHVGSRLTAYNCSIGKVILKRGLRWDVSSEKKQVISHWPRVADVRGGGS